MSYDITDESNYDDKKDDVNDIVMTHDITIIDHDNINGIKHDHNNLKS